MIRYSTQQPPKMLVPRRQHRSDRPSEGLLPPCPETTAQEIGGYGATSTARLGQRQARPQTRGGQGINPTQTHPPTTHNKH